MAESDHLLIDERLVAHCAHCGERIPTITADTPADDYLANLRRIIAAHAHCPSPAAGPAEAQAGATG